MRRFFTADTHFNHEGIIKMMGRVGPMGALMSCAEEHDHLLIGQINATVGRDDELIIIGDFAFDNPGRYRAKINCSNVRLVLGNHDRKERSANVFGQIPEVMRSKAYNHTADDHVKLFLSHYPTMYWDQSHNGCCHLYGHCHSQREEYLDDLEPQRRAMDVGVDNAYRLYGEYRPISEVEVYDYMARRSGHDDVRFYLDFQQQLYLDRGLYGNA